MGYHRFHSRILFATIGILLFGLVSTSSFLLPTGTVRDVEWIPELEPMLDNFTGSTFIVLPQEIVANFGDTFAVQIFAENVTDMWAWQIRLNFDPRLFECVNVSLPDHHVFSDRYTVSQALIDWNSTEFNFTKIPCAQLIDNDKGYVLTGENLWVNQTTFNGSGFLVQIELKAKSFGSSYLFLTPSQTFYFDPDIKDTYPRVSFGRIVIK